MKLIEVLEENRAHAISASCMRDWNRVAASMMKVAQEKGAGLPDMIGRVVDKVRPIFMSAPDIMLRRAKEKAILGLHHLVQSLPDDPAILRNLMTQETVQTLEKNVTKVLATGEKVVEKRLEQSIQPPEGLKKVQDILKITDQLSKDTKLPMKAMLGLAGAFGLGATAMAELERHSATKAHRENMVSIMRDSNIPLSLKPRAKEMYEVLVRYAPSIAKDAVFSKDFTKNLIRHDAVDHKVVSDLISAEKAYQESKGRRGEFLQALGGIALHAGGL